MYLKCTQTVYSHYLLTIMTLVIDADRNINYISNILLNLVEYTKYFHRLLSMIRVVWCFKQVSNDTHPFLVFQLWIWVKRGKLKMRSLQSLPNSHLKRYALFSQLNTPDISHTFETKLISSSLLNFFISTEKKTGACPESEESGGPLLWNAQCQEQE